MSRKATSTRVPGTRKGRNEGGGHQSQNELTALHEATHAVVAHALGRRVVYIRVRPVVLDADHPDNPGDQPLVSLGFHRSEPRLEPEVQTAVEAGVPLTPEQERWCREEMLVAAAGIVVERQCAGEGWEQAAGDDVRQIGALAGILGLFEGGEFGGPAWDAVYRSAHEIARELIPLAVELVNRLLEEGELEEEALEAVLGSHPRGSHAHLLPEFTAKRSSTGRKDIGFRGEGERPSGSSAGGEARGGDMSARSQTRQPRHEPHPLALLLPALTDEADPERETR